MSETAQWVPKVYRQLKRDRNDQLGIKEPPNPAFFKNLEQVTHTELPASKLLELLDKPSDANLFIDRETEIPLSEEAIEQLLQSVVKDDEKITLFRKSSKEILHNFESTEQVS